MLTDFFVFILSQGVFLVPSFENSGTFGEVTLSLLKCFLLLVNLLETEKNLNNGKEEKQVRS